MRTQSHISTSTLPHYGTEQVQRSFETARIEVRQWMTNSIMRTCDRKETYNAGCDLEKVGCIYVVTRKGRVIGKGLHFETAIADAESNL